MLHTVTEREFKDLMLQKEFADEARKPVAVMAYHALFTGYADKLSTIDLAIMGNLIARTLSVGRRAARIATVEFTQGTRETGIQTVCGLPIGRTALRDHLRILTDMGLLQVYRTISGDDGVEKEARMFEIDCKNLMNYEFPTQESGVLGGRETDTPGRQTTTPSYINTIDSLNIVNKDKSLYSARSSRSSSSLEVNVFALPKRPKSVTARPDSIAAVLGTVKAKATATATVRTTSAAAKAPHHLTKDEMQQVFDNAMAIYGEARRRVIVTGKEYGVLRKRLRADPPANFKHFVEWLIRSWATVAHQNRVAVKRSVERQERGDKGLPMGIDFATVAYKYPYFAKVYEASLRESGETEADAPKQSTEAEILKRQLAEALQGQEVLRQKLVRRSAVPAIRRGAIAPRVVPTPRILEAELPSAELPEWETKNTFGVKRYAK